MFKQLSFFFLLVLGIGYGFPSCKSRGSTEIDSLNTISSSTSKITDTSAQYFIGRNLNTLWVYSNEFLKLDKTEDVAFRFFLDKKENLLISGWPLQTM